MVPTTAQETISKFMADFEETEEEAIKRWESITHTVLPEIIKALIKEV